MGLLAIWIIGTTVISSCATLYKHPRPHRHHPRRHHVVIMARQNATTEHNMNCIPHKAYRDMAESSYSYGDTE